MRVAIAAALLMLSTTAYGQQATIIDACLKVAALEMGGTELVAEDVQAFPELSPPRVQMNILQKRPPRITDAISGNPTPAYESAGQIRCEFERPIAPFTLRDYDCSCRIWFSSEQKRLRLEEMQVLLAREDF